MEFWAIEFDEHQNGKMVLKLGMFDKEGNEMPVAVIEENDTHYRLAFIAASGKTAYVKDGINWKIEKSKLQEELPPTIENALMLKVMFG